MRVFINRVPQIFGGIWDFMYELHGLPKNKTRAMDKNNSKMHASFFELLGMDWCANRQWLKHYAFVQSVSNFARAVRRKAGTAFVCIGHLLAYT